MDTCPKTSYAVTSNGGIAAMLVKVESLELAIDLYHAGLVRWWDGEAWTKDNAYAEPSEYSKECTYIELEE